MRLLGPKNHDSQRHDRIPLVFSLPGNLAIFFIFWVRSTQLHRKPWMKGEESTGENSKDPVEMAPRHCRFLSLVVVERGLSLRCLTFQSCPCKSPKAFWIRRQFPCPTFVHLRQNIYLLGRLECNANGEGGKRSSNF